MKEELLAAETNIIYFTAHSCRAASSSKVKQIVIEKRVSCKGEHTFQNFQNKDVIDNLRDFDYSSVSMTKNVSK